MAKLIQQSTANDPLFFFLVLTSDHISPATGKSPTVTISKNGGAFGSPAGAVSEIANGWYQVAANATDTGTLGDILLHASEASSDNCDLVAAQVVAFNPRNANLGLLNVSANVAQWNSASVAAPATAGVPDINVKNFNNVGAVSLPSNFNLLAIDGSGNVTAGLSSNIKKNSAQSGFMFVMTNSTTHQPQAGLTVSGTVYKDGAAEATLTNPVTEISNGVYVVNLAAADTNCNHMLLRFTANNADDRLLEIITQP